MHKLQRRLIYLAIVLMPFQDSILGKTSLGYLGSNISFIPILASALVGLAGWLCAGSTMVSRPGLTWLTYALGISSLYIILWGTVSHGFSVVHKTFAEGLVFFLWAYVIFRVDYTPSAGLRNCTYVAFWILILGVFACDLPTPGLAAIGSSSIFHITPSYEADRWRSFSMEPSTFSATVVSLGLASAHFARSKWARNGFIVLTLTLLIASQSKGGLLVLMMSGFILLLLKKPAPLRMVFYFFVCLIVGAAMAFLAARQVSGGDVFNTTATLATRFSLAVWTLIVVAHYPWGVGFSGFYQALTIYLPAAMNFVARVSPIPLNFIEIKPYVYATDAPLDAKCFLFEYLATFGIPFLVAYVIFARRTIRSLLEHRQNILLTGFVFLLIGFSTYVNGLTLYASFYVAGLSYREYRLWAAQHQTALQLQSRPLYMA